ncbi:hypothetical protein [Paraglaciecola sp.]|uniref:hypothetical protein n=1 Tax=Paraglaciecola sp. TaxID=1920173 RepID=UPI003264DEC4
MKYLLCVLIVLIFNSCAKTSRTASEPIPASETQESDRGKWGWNLKSQKEIDRQRQERKNEQRAPY